MKYMLLIQAPTNPDASEQAAQCEFEDWQIYDKSVREAGILVASHALADLTTTTSVKVDPTGDRTVIDGPFAESREVLGGYYVIDVPDLDAALDWAVRCPGSRGGGSVQVRPVADF